jgi:hypothetical protein
MFVKDGIWVSAFHFRGELPLRIGLGKETVCVRGWAAEDRYVTTRSDRGHEPTCRSESRQSLDPLVTPCRFPGGRLEGIVTGQHYIEHGVHVALVDGSCPCLWCTSRKSWCDWTHAWSTIRTTERCEFGGRLARSKGLAPANASHAMPAALQLKRSAKLPAIAAESPDAMLQIRPLAGSCPGCHMASGVQLHEQ